MTTAVDTNVFSALWSAEVRAPAVGVLLYDAKQQGRVLICGVVLSELLAHPTFPESSVRAFLRDTGVVIDFEMREEIWSDAGRRYARYASRRKSSGAAEPRRILADFLIGAHAMSRADRLMTLDRAHYERNFPELALHPSAPF